MKDPLNALLAAAGRVSSSPNDADGPKNFTFDSNEAVFEHVRKFKGIEFGDVVIVHRNNGNVRAVFLRWDERGFAVLVYRDEENELSGMACPMSCLTLPE